ncbi:MAG: K(+)-transporting ATPase subunit C [Chloroflexi bacterium]|nr:K(+)-transporting ATPase subunit C [Chloroflexota bacterium]GIW12144.1 MAG: potassium-transporting ATPase KdpC subunit [Dehalococcoidia bacterium]
MALLPTLRSAVLATVVLTLLTGLLYPLTLTGLAQLLFPFQANGSLLRNESGQVVGSVLIGQAFQRPEYFHPRPSAAGAGYDAMASGASHLGPTSRALVAGVQERVVAYRQENGLPPEALVPTDAVTASGSGLDPHISLANALLQVPRVARARGLPESEVRALVEQMAEGRTLGIFGEPRVNVLLLNRALEARPRP